MSLRTLLNNQREQLDRLNKRTLRRFLSAYREAKREVRERLDSLAEEREWSRFNLLTAQAQIEDGIRYMSLALRDELAHGAGRATRLGSRDFERRWSFLSKRYGADATPFNLDVLRILDRTEFLLLHRFDVSRMSYGDQVIQRMRSELERSFLLRESPGQAIPRIMRRGGICDEEQWRAARIVRTELANTYEMASWEAGNVAIEDGIVEGLQKRMINPMDSRTAPDSYAQHGQVRSWREPYVDEHGAYMYPPARPNDRATSMPWMPAWKEDTFLEEKAPPAT